MPCPSPSPRLAPPHGNSFFFEESPWDTRVRFGDTLSASFKRNTGKRGTPLLHMLIGSDCHRHTFPWPWTLQFHVWQMHDEPSRMRCIATRHWHWCLAATTVVRTTESAARSKHVNVKIKDDGIERSNLPFCRNHLWASARWPPYRKWTAGNKKEIGEKNF